MAAPGCPSTQLDLEVPTPTAQCTAGSGTPGGESDLAWRLVLAKAKSVSGPHGPLGKQSSIDIYRICYGSCTQSGVCKQTFHFTCCFLSAFPTTPNHHITTTDDNDHHDASASLTLRGANTLGKMSNQSIAEDAPNKDLGPIVVAE